MNIVEIYCAKNKNNEMFLENGVNLILEKDKDVYSKENLQKKKEELKTSLAQDFIKENPDWICEECGAPVVCYDIDSYNEYYSCVGDGRHSFNVN
jgi:hypothetical protein